MTLVVNLFGGPGSGKSTTAAGVFCLLKLHGVNCEYVSEYAKDLAWEETLTVFYDQYKILGEQHSRQKRLQDKTDVMITDSPILQQCAYVDDKLYETLCHHIAEPDNKLNFYIVRKKDFKQEGRKETELEALAVDTRLKTILRDNKYMFTEIDGNWEAINKILFVILDKLNIQAKTFLRQL